VVVTMPDDYTDPGTGTPAADWTPLLSTSATSRASLTVPGLRRLVVVSAHPDDETLGAGGLISTCAAAGLDVLLLCLSDGTGSHPRSPTHSPEQLAARRAEEYVAAAAELGVASTAVTQLALPDGAIGDHVPEVTGAVADLIGADAPGDTLVASTWTQDGHPDHEAVGRGAAEAVRRTGATHWQFPVWFWHWATPADPRVGELHPFSLGPAAQEAKRRAVAAHVSQVTPLSPAPGDETLLDADFLAHFDREQEWFVTRAPAGSTSGW
jgi:LmbE family N-acetylglucosaminyl deacetylase